MRVRVIIIYKFTILFSLFYILHRFTLEYISAVFRFQKGWYTWDLKQERNMLSESTHVYYIGTSEMYPSEFPMYAARINDVPFERILI
jgi:hypothetical protein